ncbi:GAF domain-containing protein [Actinoplanes sp. NPDC051513]|uniref:sensor histidine kinase n=1 Tax=Actinoplanes sp. NPDC051513 TaxID=3363908 RepID=UPI0037B45924
MRRLPLYAETALALVAGVAAFVLTAVVGTFLRMHVPQVPAVALGLVLLAGVLATARALGILYALPVGVAAIEAFDWFFLPPLRDFDDSAAILLGLFIVMAVIVGSVATAATRRAVRSERAHAELLNEQVALRRVATLVAGGAAPGDVFGAIADELAGLLGADSTFVTRLNEPPESVTVVGSFGGVTADMPVGYRIVLTDAMLLNRVVTTGEAGELTGPALREGPFGALVARLGVRVVFAAPIVVGGRLWGVVVAGTARPAFPEGTEARVGDFIHLAALAIGNAQAVQQLRALAEEQASLRRLALLIAQDAAPELVFAAVTKEVLRQFGSGTARMIRYELDGSATLLANEGSTGPHVRVGHVWEGYPPEGITATIHRTGQTARVHNFKELPGGEKYADEGLIWAVGMPIHANGRLWGMIAVGSGEGRLPDDLEGRLAEFTDLVAIAVANAQSRAELISSRARIVAAADEARRQIERDLHDGAQQRLVALALRLRTAAVDDLPDLAADLLVVIDELRELSRGIHPAVLSDSGLRPALRALGRRSPLPVEIDVRLDGRLPQPVEIGAYYVVSEVLTNAVKHAGATVVTVDAAVEQDRLVLTVTDDGSGGADPARGSGLRGLMDRIEALGGTIEVRSPAGEGTTITCRVPVEPASK